jgi:DHA2 family multidrug resistance protein
VWLLLLPAVGQLRSRFQALHHSVRWITLAAGLHLSTKPDPLISFGTATGGVRLLQYVPFAFLFDPITRAGYVGLPEEKTNAPAGLLNFMCNIEQSVATRAVTTHLARRTQYHESVLA